MRHVNGQSDSITVSDASDSCQVASFHPGYFLNQSRVVAKVFPTENIRLWHRERQILLDLKDSGIVPEVVGLVSLEENEEFVGFIFDHYNPVYGLEYFPPLVFEQILRNLLILWKIGYSHGTKSRWIISAKDENILFFDLHAATRFVSWFDLAYGLITDSQALCVNMVGIISEREINSIFSEVPLTKDSFLNLRHLDSNRSGYVRFCNHADSWLRLFPERNLCVSCLREIVANWYSELCVDWRDKFLRIFLTGVRINEATDDDVISWLQNQLCGFRLNNCLPYAFRRFLEVSSVFIESEDARITNLNSLCRNDKRIILLNDRLASQCLASLVKYVTLTERTNVLVWNLLLNDFIPHPEQCNRIRIRDAIFDLIDWLRSQMFVSKEDWYLTARIEIGISLHNLDCPHNIRFGEDLIPLVLGTGFHGTLLRASAAIRYVSEFKSLSNLLRSAVNRWTCHISYFSNLISRIAFIELNLSEKPSFDSRAENALCSCINIIFGTNHQSSCRHVLSSRTSVYMRRNS